MNPAGSERGRAEPGATIIRLVGPSLPVSIIVVAAGPATPATVAECSPSKDPVAEL